MAPLAICLVWAWLLAAAPAASAVWVRLPDGSRLLGAATSTARTGRPVYEFRGVRYASAPSSERFKHSQPVGPLGEYNATQFAPPCPPAFSWSNDWFTDPDPEVLANLRQPAEDEDQEDCLFLNVFTPTLDPGARMAVLVHIHGGSYIAGSPLLARPGFMLEHDLLLVTVQYRLFVPGFLYVGTDDAPGNMGLLDMTTALSWVQQNIASFGGDPGRVTISGGSAGAAAVELLAYSPIASQLFHQVLPMSGSAHAAWAMEKPEDAFRAAKNIARLAGCNSTRPEEMVGCLRSVPIANLSDIYMEHAMSFWDNDVDTLVGVTPVVQDRRLRSPAVLPASPRELCAPWSAYRGRPMMVGVTKHDGHFFVGHGLHVWMNSNVTERERLYRMQSFLMESLKTEYDPVIADALYEKYLNGYNRTEDIFIALTDFIGAAKFKGPMIKSANCNTNHGGKTYVYTLNHVGHFPNQAVEHGMDVLYLSPRSDFRLSEEDEKVSRRLVHLHANFIMYGDPTPNTSRVDGVPQWPPYEPRGGPYLRVDWPFRVQRDFEAREFNVTRAEGIGRSGSRRAGATVAVLLLCGVLRQLLSR
ncbi:cholinesterase 1-like [Schistocerca cancellata]|uniref:cholinesterase 1-like n=1 Tax=Schistocerca cancellata TaxID=274614 RepID=UPI0021177BEC|nr:cholinesterase 1-like [Schistocerca cancellata]